MRRALTKEEQHKIAGKMFEHLESTNWKIERGPPAEGHGQYLMPKLQGIGLVRSNSYLPNCVTLHTPQARIRDRSKMKRLQRRYLCQGGDQERRPCTPKSRSKERTTKSAQLAVAPV
jgi:hypothetical protein